MATRVALAALAAYAALASPLDAQKKGKPSLLDPPPRPALGPGADTNDAQGYLQHGRRLILSGKSASADAFYWAMRLDPGLAEPYVLRMNALALRAKRKLTEDERKHLDSLRLKTLLRDPFAMSSEGIGVFLCYAPERCVLLRPSLEDARGELARRADNIDARLYLASLHYAAQRFDSAAAQVSQVLERLRAEDAKTLRPVYHSKALFEYALGKALMRLGEMNAAKEAFGRALAEDLAFYPAHSAIGAIAWTNWHNLEQARHEFELAIELAPNDPLTHYDYATVLLQAGKLDEAVARFREAIRAEPFFANSYFNLALTLDRLGRGAEAVEAYEQFVRHAPRLLDQPREQARQRIAALRAGGA